MTLFWNNPLTRAAGRWIEHEHYCRLGIRNSMRLAKRLNRRKNRRLCRFRNNLLATSMGELYEENGNQAGSAEPVVLRDGYALDTSRTLPHLDQLIADSQEIIAERGGKNRGGQERSFFQQLLTDAHIQRYPSLLDFAVTNEVLRPVVASMGEIPVLSSAKPLGVRLNESDMRLSEPTNGVFRESQLFHRDYHDAPMVYVIVTLRDVTLQSGPFSILPASVSAEATRALNYGRRGSPYRVTDDRMYEHVDRQQLFEFACPAGSVLYVDSSACFHYGSRDAEIPRYLMMYAYVSVARTDFGDILRPESETPVLDDSARLRRSRYPVADSDSRLRRLLLDRNACW